MRLFGKRTQPEPVDRDQVMRLIKSGMDWTDAADRDIDDDPRFAQATTAWNREAGRSTKAELDRAYEALKRHGY